MTFKNYIDVSELGVNCWLGNRKESALFPSVEVPEYYNISKYVETIQLNEKLRFSRIFSLSVLHNLRVLDKYLYCRCEKTMSILEFI